MTVSRYLQMQGRELPEGEDLNGKFADAAMVSPWAKASVEAMAAAGLIQGDGVSLNPKGNATRAEAAAVITRMMDYAGI